MAQDTIDVLIVLFLLIVRHAQSAMRVLLVRIVEPYSNY